MKLFKIIINFFKSKNNTEQTKTNLKKKKVKYTRNKYGFFSREVARNKEISLNNKK